MVGMATLPFTQLEAFLAVARMGSFSNAARELAVSRSAVSQAVRQLEEQLRVGLVVRTTRSVALTSAGRKLVESAAPAFAQVSASLREVSAKPGETVGRVRLSVPRMALSLLATVLPTFRARHPRIEVEVSVQDRFVDIVAEGFDAGVRLTEAIQRDMVQLRLSEPFRFVVVGAPAYLAKHGTPEHPKDLLRHECFTFRSETNGTLYAWELERGRKAYRVPVQGSMVINDAELSIALAEQGMGLLYAFEPMILDRLKSGRLRVVLERYAPTVPGFFLYYPSRAQRSAPLRLLVEAASEVTGKRRGKTVSGSL